MANELKEILKRANKTKLIQLAVDSDNVGGRKLDTEEIEIIKNRAYKEGWDDELERATFKAKDITVISIEAIGNIYKAMFYLQSIAECVSVLEMLLDRVTDDYIKDYNEQTEKYETIITKEDKELETEVSYLANRYFFTNLYRSMPILSLDKYFEMYKHFITNAKQGSYLLTRSKIGGYRLYKKKDVEELTTTLQLNTIVGVDVINALDHTIYLIEKTEEYIPKVLDILRKTHKDRVPRKELLEEIAEYIRTNVTEVIPFNELKKLMDDEVSGKKKIDREERDQLEKERILSEQYLFKGVTEETKLELDSALNKLIEYVKYGR